MELIDVLKTLNRRKWFVSSVFVAIVALSMVIVWLMPPAYNTSVVMGIKQEGVQQTDEFQYDGFYSLQAADLFSDTVSNMFTSPEIVKEIYSEAGLDTGTDNLRKLSTIFDAEKTSPQTVVVSFQTATEEDAIKLVTALDTVVQRRTASLQEDAEKEIGFGVFTDKPITLPRDPDIVFISVFVVLLALIVSFFITFFVEYLAQAKIKK